MREVVAIESSLPNHQSKYDEQKIVFDLRKSYSFLRTLKSLIGKRRSGGNLNNIELMFGNPMAIVTGVCQQIETAFKLGNTLILNRFIYAIESRFDHGN